MFKLPNCTMYVSVLSAWAFEIMLAVAFYDRWYLACNVANDQSLETELEKP